MADKNKFQGFQQVNGLAEDFNENNLENGVFYLVRTDGDKEDGYIYLNGKKYGNSIFVYDEDVEEEIVGGKLDSAKLDSFVLQ